MDIHDLIAQPWFVFTIGFLGMICHFLKKYAKNQLEVKEQNPLKGLYVYFFRTDFVNTIMTVIAYTVVFFVMYQINETGILSSFSAGYMANSLFNKAEEKGIRI